MTFSQVCFLLVVVVFHPGEEGCGADYPGNLGGLLGNMIPNRWTEWLRDGSVHQQVVSLRRMEKVTA